MVANTNQVEKWIAQIAGLEATAIGLIQRKKRSPLMVEALIKALQLFKENSLGEVYPDDVADRRRRLRRDFYRRTSARYREQDIPVAELPLSKEMSAKLFLYCGQKPGAGVLINLVKMSREKLCEVIGESATNEMSRLLDDEGLSLGMPKDEIIEAFGKAE